MNKVHIPLISKSVSTDIKDNFLIQKDNIFVMDNHRLALWSWLQCVDLKNKYNLIHIDAHPDLSMNGIESFKSLNKMIHNLSLDEYRTIKQEDIQIPIFRWDNYLQFFLKYYSENILETYSFTHKLGSSEKLKHDFSDIHLLREMEAIFSQKRFVNDAKWILNLDLDFFLASQPHKVLMYSENYLNELFKSIKLGLDNNMIEVFTIAFSPECCGSWENAEAIYRILNDSLKLGIEIK